MDCKVIDLTPRIKDSLYEHLAGVGFRRKRGALTLREKLERKAWLKMQKKAKVLPFRKMKRTLENSISREVIS